MKYIFTLTAAALPAAAQMTNPPPSQAMGSQTNGNGAAAANGMAMENSCQGMMDKAVPMADGMADGSRKTMAMKHMDMAKMDMTKNDDAGCKKQMHMAMKAMM
jgi:hypothetical protein